MNKEKEQEVYINSETIAYQIAGILNKSNEKCIDKYLVYQTIKSLVKNNELIEDIYNATIQLLEEKYGILFNVDKKVNI